jgi:hypothetical protein
MKYRKVFGFNKPNGELYLALTELKCTRCENIIGADTLFMRGTINRKVATIKNRAHPVCRKCKPFDVYINGYITKAKPEEEKDCLFDTLEEKITSIDRFTRFV